jgi:peptide/nickel transport system substrate-binding protein
LAAVEKYPYDPNRAAAQFQSLGYAKGPDGFLRNTSTGQRLEPIEFRTTGEQPFQIRMLAAMSDYFKNVGLDISQVVVPQERTSDRPYRVTNPGMEELQFGYGPSTMIGFMHSSKLPTPENRYITGNYPRYANPAWDALNDKYAVSIAPAERKQALMQIFRYLNEELPDMSIIYGVSVQFASNRLNVPEVNPIWTAEQWDLK